MLTKYFHSSFEVEQCHFHTVKSNVNSLFIQENGNDNADDEDHSQDWAYHPYESVTSLDWQGVHIRLSSLHCVGVRTGSEHFLNRKIRENLGYGTIYKIRTELGQTKGDYLNNLYKKNESH